MPPVKGTVFLCFFRYSSGLSKIFILFEKKIFFLNIKIVKIKKNMIKEKF